MRKKFINFIAIILNVEIITPINHKHLTNEVKRLTTERDMYKKEVKRLGKDCSDELKQLFTERNHYKKSLESLQKEYKDKIEELTNLLNT